MSPRAKTTFGQGYGKLSKATSNSKRNQDALKKMTIAQIQTGKTVAELKEEQEQLRDDFYRRQAERNV